MSEQLSPERLASPEEEQGYSSRILLHFTRHGDKTKDIGDGSNVVQVLTRLGKQQGWEKGEKLAPAKPTAIAFGGDIIRSQEMAGHMLAGAEGNEDITGDETPEELKAKLDKDRKIGTRLAIDPRLSFHYESKEVWKACELAYKRGEGLKWFIEESDEFIAEHGNDRETSYSRMSANIASFLQKYIIIAPRFDKIVNDEEKMQAYSDTLERFVGSHAGSIDLFLCKVIEKIKGPEERDRLVRMLGNQAFDVAEGFDVEVQMIDDQPQVKVSYERKGEGDEEDFIFNENIPLETLDKIISDGEATKTGKV